MNIFSGIVVFVLIWWMIFFCTLPFGLTDAKPEGGNMPGAPVNPRLKIKLIITTGIAIVFWVVAYLIITSDLLSFHDIAQKMKT